MAILVWLQKINYGMKTMLDKCLRSKIGVFRAVFTSDHHINI